jgi:Zn-dependent peptidase ImmA (M78 family)
MKLRYPIDFTIRLGRGIKTDAEKAAELLRRRNGIAAAARLPARVAARNLGIVVVHPHQLPSITAEILHELENEGSGKWSAIFLPIPDPGRHLIINNRTHSAGRQEANIFHELGHCLCGHEPDDIEWINGFPIRQYSKEKEDQADAVGQALHLPKSALFAAASRSLTEEQICEAYCASAELVRFRMNITGVRKILRRSKR